MGLIIAGIVLILAAVVLYFISRSNARLAQAAGAAGVSSVGDLKTLYQKVRAEVGDGLFSQPAGLQGTVECEQPLRGELSDTVCVAYSFRVERRWEEDYEERDDEGHLQRRTRNGSDTVASNDRRVSFRLNDGDVLEVEPDGADVDMEKVVDRFEPGNPGTTLQLGGFKFALGSLSMGNRRLLGYHYHEEVLPLGRRVYVLGTARDAGGALRIGKDDDGKAPFVISRKSREQLLKSTRQTAMYTQYAAYACAPVGLILAIIGLLHH